MPLPTAPDVNAPLAEWAQWYAAQDWPVFPCHTPVPGGCSCHDPACNSIGKHPRTRHGKDDATTDPFDIATWWRQWPDANIGAIMGHGRWALDIDPRNGGDDTLFELERRYGLLPHTLLNHTGGKGSHYVWKENGQAIPHAVWKNRPEYAGVDIIALGGYIILPPSLHVSGQHYCWDLIDGPDDITPQLPPDWLVNLLHQPGGTSGSRLVSPEGPILPGGRNNALSTFAYHLRTAGATLEEIHAAVSLRNIQQCKPPLDENEVQAIVYGKKHLPIGSFFEATQAVDVPQRKVTTVNGYAQPLDSTENSTPVWSYRLPLTDFADMLERTYPLPQWIIKGLIPEGLTFFVGSPKSSKTYLAYSLALSLVSAMAHPGQVQWLGHYDLDKHGPVIYMTLEDDESDTFYRVKELAPGLTSIPRDRLLFIHDINLPYLGQGLTEVLQEQVMEVYHPALVVLDPISYLYAPQQKSNDQFAQVKQMLLPLRWLGKQYHCGILGVDHRRKKSADDVDIFETQYGSNAKVAVNDAQLVIVRDDKDITVHCQVRKAGNQTLSLGLEFTPDGYAEWTWKGSSDGMILQGAYGDLRMKVLTVLQAGQLSMTIDDMITACALPDSRNTKQAIDQVLRRAIRAGEIVKGARRGEYVWAGGN